MLSRVIVCKTAELELCGTIRFAVADITKGEVSDATLGKWK
jgi:hypothetical protein